MTIKLNRAKEILEKCKDQRILVVGDLMLDRYVYGNVSRISPEAPVPVVHVNREKSVPGGASNVSANIGSLKGTSGVAGVLGSDADAAELKKLLKKAGIQTSGIVDFPQTRTTVKTRVIADRQQVVRIDWEDGFEFSKSLLENFCKRLVKEVKKSTGVILEDYGKGVIRQEIVDTVLAAARDADVPVGLDPKDNHELVVAGITLATPNRKEAFIAARIEESKPHENPLKDIKLLRVGEILLQKWKPDLLMITLGPQGMLLMSSYFAPRHVPTRAREVFDVSGAGDTVIAVCLLAVAAGADYNEAAELANYAAGVVVGKLGTATCTPDELLEYIRTSQT